MYVPPVIKERLNGPGFFLTFPAVGLLAFASVAAWGKWGLLWLGLAIGVGLIGALWWESAIVSGQSNEAHDRADTAQTERDAAVEERNQLRLEMHGLQTRLTSQEAALSEVRREQRQPELSLRKLLFSLEAQLKDIDLVQKHRALATHSGSTHWPAVSITREPEDGLVTVIAHVDGGGERLTAEPVCLIHGEPPDVIGRAIIRRADAREIAVGFRMGDIVRAARRQLGSADTDPEPYSIALVGLEASPFRHLNDEELLSVYEKLTEVVSSISKLVTPTRVAVKEV